VKQNLRTYYSIKVRRLANGSQAVRAGRGSVSFLGQYFHPALVDLYSVLVFTEGTGAIEAVKRNYLTPQHKSYDLKFTKHGSFLYPKPLQPKLGCVLSSDLMSHMRRHIGM
jgi:hypothetical protein